MIPVLLLPSVAVVKAFHSSRRLLQITQGCLGPCCRVLSQNATRFRKSEPGCRRLGAPRPSIGTVEVKYDNDIISACPTGHKPCLDLRAAGPSMGFSWGR